VVDFSGTDPVGFSALTIPDFAWGQKMPKLQPLLISCLLITVIAAICAAEPQSCPIPTAYGQNASAGHFAEVNGIRMYYETYGSGPSLLLVHGNGGSIYGMRCQIAYFSRSYRVIAADNRSHGKTEDGKGRLTYEQMADDLAALLDQLKVDSVDIIGQSDGGILALLLAMRHPSKVNKLVASSPNLRPDTTALSAWVFPIMKADLDAANAMIANGDHSQNWDRVKRWNELMLNEPHIAVTDLHKIQAPALIMGGDADVITPEHLIEIYRNTPKAHLAILPGATHFIHQKEYERYNSMAERFLREPFTRPTAKQEIENERF
jgi:pimeloyl-ACP methyl ester carboxylesterase